MQVTQVNKIRTSADTLNEIWSSINYNKLNNTCINMLQAYNVYCYKEEEIVHEAILKASKTILKKNNNGEQINNYESYIVMSIRNVILTKLDNMKKQGISIDTDNYFQDNSNFTKIEYQRYYQDLSSSYRKLKLGEVFDDMQKILEEESITNPDKINPLHISIFRYYYFLGISYKKLSQRLGYSIFFISTAVRNCRNILKEKLDDNYLNKFRL